jgi:hypothetical protein
LGAQPPGEGGSGRPAQAGLERGGRLSPSIILSIAFLAVMGVWTIKAENRERLTMLSCFCIIAFVGINPGEMAIPEIWESEDDRFLSVNKLREKCIEYARYHFIKTPHLAVENQNTKWEIEITTQVIKEWRQKSRTRPRIIAIRLLDEMIKTAVLVKTEKDNQQSRGIESVSEFENWCMIEGKLYKIRIVVKKQPDRYFVYYFGAVGQKDK